MRAKLYKHIENIINSKCIKETIQTEIKIDKSLYSFFDIIYNKNYEYEFSKDFNVTSKWTRENSGSMDWSDISKKIYALLIQKDAAQSQNFPKLFERYLKDFNQKDIEIILHGLKTRSLKKIKSSVIYDLFPEFDIINKPKEIKKETNNV